jgi:hypothetical protein
VLFQSGNREVIKCAIMFLRVALATMDGDAFKAALPTVHTRDAMLHVPVTDHCLLLCMPVQPLFSL